MKVEGGHSAEGHHGVVEVAVVLIFFFFGQDADGLVGRHAESVLVVGQGEEVVVALLFGLSGEPGVAVRAIRAVRAADAIPRRAVVHTQVPSVVVFQSIVGHDRSACDAAAQADPGRGGRLAIRSGASRRTGGTVRPIFAVGTILSVLSVLAILAILAIGSDGVTCGVGHEFAVERPVPVAVVGPRQAYPRGLPVGSRLTLRPVIDGDGVAVPEGDGIAQRVAALGEGGDGGDHIRRVEQLPHAGDALVGLFLPLLEGSDALFVVVHFVPKGGVVILVVTRGGNEQQGDEEAQFVNLS